jgi:hypothetical protein
MLKNPRGMKETLVGKFVDISHLVSPALLLCVSAGYYQRALVDESGMIRN